MCFGPVASFGVGAVLVPSGVYCLQVAARRNGRLLAVAAVPFLFGVQQTSEGLVWLGLLDNRPELARGAAVVFLLPALALWPFWIPFMTWLHEGDPWRRRLLLGITLVSTCWFWMLYLPVVTGPEEVLTIEIQNHSIAYHYGETPVFRVLPARLLNLLYGLMVTAPLLISSDRRGYWPSVVIGASAVVALLLYHFVFVSVWCFLAAVLTVYLVWVFHGLAQQAAQPGDDLDGQAAGARARDRGAMLPEFGAGPPDS